MKEDFYKLLDAAIVENLKKEKTVLVESVQLQKQTEFDTKQSELSHVFERENAEIKERYEEQIEALKVELGRLQVKLEEEREALAQRFECEKEALEDQLVQQIRDELESAKWRKRIRHGRKALKRNREVKEEFVQQMEEIKEAYEDEKREFESQSALLRQEVEDLQQEVEAGNQNRKKMDDLKRTNTKLLQEKRRAEKGQADLRKTLEESKKSLEARIDELMAEKEGAITAVKTQFVESSKQNGKERAAFDALLMEKEGLERRVTSLTQELTELQNMTESSRDTHKQIERLTRENEDLRNRSSETGPSSGSVPEHAQRAISELTREKRELEEQLVDIQNRYEEIEDLAKKYSHLQFDYGQMSIGHSVIEESLLETQDNLADTEAKLNQSERELRDARRYKDKYRLLQKKYEDVYKERDNMSHLAKSLKEQLNKANTAQKEEHEDKGQLTSVFEEKKLLELQLQKISDKLLEATTNFSVSQSQHIQELQQWKEQCSNMVDLQKYTKLQIDLVDNQKSLRDLQGIVKNKEETSTNKFKETSEKHHEQVKWLENQKDALSRQLTTLQNILDV